MMMDTPKSTPRPRWRLTEVRTLRGWSQQEVADRIGSTYVNVSRWERGITRPNPYFRRKLCALFGKSEEELDLGGGVDITERATTDGDRVTTTGDRASGDRATTTTDRATATGDRATTRVAPTMDD